MKCQGLLLGLICLVLLSSGFAQESTRGERHETQVAKRVSLNAEKDEEPLVSLGTNLIPEVTESSGVAISSFVSDAIWTLNDSGHPNRLYLLKTDGKLLARVDLRDSQNIDWEAMARFKFEDKRYLLVGDFGDNAKSRKNYQLYIVPEPDLSASLASSKPGEQPASRHLSPIRLDFTYEDGPKNCEAVAVDVLGKQIWLVEKIYVDTSIKAHPGIYVLPLLVEKPAKPLVAKRIGNFPPRNVTGMDFSSDGRRLIIRNYVNAHLYSRENEESWEEVISKTNPATVVLPLQRQGEAVCFTDDSASVILTSEFLRQPIWQVKLKQYYKMPRRIKNR